jgi:hypothetical protein
MPVECKEEVLPPDTLPSYGGTVELHFAVSVIALESKNKINNCTILLCMNVIILKLSDTSTTAIHLSYITSVYTSPALSHNQDLNLPHSLPKHHSLEYTQIKQLRNTSKSHESGVSRESS